MVRFVQNCVLRSRLVGWIAPIGAVFCDSLLMHVRSFLSQSCRNALQGENHAAGGVGRDYSGESFVFFSRISNLPPDVAGRASAQMRTLTDPRIQTCLWRLSGWECTIQGHPDPGSVRMKALGVLSKGG